MNFHRSMKKLKSNLLSLFLAIAVSLTTLPYITEPIQVQAAGASDYADALFVDVIGSHGSGGNSKIVNGISYARTGYLCYMLTETGGNVPRAGAILLKCQGYNEIPGASIICTSKKGGFVKNSFDGTAPWPYTPFNENKTTNQAQIKAWMMEEDGNGIPNASNVVSKYWGTEVAQKFSSNEYILVIETVLHFQYSVSTGGANKAPQFNYYQVKVMLQNKYPNIATNIPDSMIMQVMDDLNAKLDEYYKSSGAGFQTVGSPIVGTCTDCLNYFDAVVSQYTSKNYFSSYLNSIAPFAERITKGGAGEKAGFIPWTASSSGKLTNDEVRTYGVAMMVITAKRDGQTTCDEPLQPTPHPAPLESQGKTQIVKNYRTLLPDNTYTEDGCHTRTNVSNKIIIEEEEEYKVVGWVTTNATTHPIDSITTTNTERVLFFCIQSKFNTH